MDRGLISKPNVVFVLTDDQGYGDLSCNGNPWLKTPNIDAFQEQSVRLEDFHAQPLCTPTRGALMTGRRPLRNGAWATCWGRSILRRTEKTMAGVFQENGYATALFGKWHLGDNHPYRPFERGFQHVVAHQGGGVGQAPDFWGNNYFDDTYFANGQARRYKGYCTDVWFELATDFIRSRCGEPFLCYIATNAPHCPYLVEERYKKPYEGNPAIPHPAFYGMIANIDENFGRLMNEIDALGISENTVVVFMTDNGSSGGARLDKHGFAVDGFNAGMRGMKGSYYDGGHRVPCFIRHPASGVEGGRAVSDLVCDIDLLPTLIDICGIENTAKEPFDGRSAAPLLKGEADALPERVDFLQYNQAPVIPEKWSNAVMTRKWRLVNGRELYDIKKDPGQREDVSSSHPDIVAWLRSEHESWWNEVDPSLRQICPIVLGNDAENPTRLCCMDVMGDVAWHQGHVISAAKNSGRWRVEVERAGRYSFRLRRWPEELPIPMRENVSAEFAESAVYPGAERVDVFPVEARLALGALSWKTPVSPEREEAVFEIELDAATECDMEALFIDKEGEPRGAYYVIVERIPAV